MRADSWEQPGAFQEATYQSADLSGNPGSLSGCNALDYEPRIEARPSTEVADSPTGLEFDLRQPTGLELGEGEGRYGTRADAQLRNARVTLPEGLVANPSQADGLEACTQEQIGYLGEGHYRAAPELPDASKLGTVEVSCHGPIHRK